MEILTILFSSLLGAIAPSSFVIDTVVEERIRSKVESVERLEVRVDNIPSYQVLGGRIDRVRIAARGITFSKFRFDTLELETDSIDINFRGLQQGEEGAGIFLQQPVQAGMRILLTEEDINNALQSPEFTARLQQVFSTIADKIPGAAASKYQVTNVRIELLEGNRFRFQGQVSALKANSKLAEKAIRESQQRLLGGKFLPSQLTLLQLGRKQEQLLLQQQSLNLLIESGVELESGTYVQLVNPTISVNNNPLPSFVTQRLVSVLADSLDLRNLEQTGLTLRLLQLSIDEDVLKGTAFIRFQWRPVSQ